MKKLICFTLAIIILTFTNFSADASSVKRQPSNITTKITYLKNGDYIETIFKENPRSFCPKSSKKIQFKKNSFIAKSKGGKKYTNTKTGKKTTYYKNKHGKVMWSLTVHGTFRYKYGLSSKCTKSTVSLSQHSSNWRFSHTLARHSGDTAIAKTTAKRSADGSIVQILKSAISIKCNKFGKLS